MNYNHKPYIIILLLLPFIVGAAAQPPPPGDQVAETIKTEIRNAVLDAIALDRDDVLAFSIYDVRVDNIKLSSDREWSVAWLIPINPNSGEIVPTEPGLVISRLIENEWTITLPSDHSLAQLIEDVPDELLSDIEKEMWLYKIVAGIPNEDKGPFHGYLLPWEKGKTVSVSQSVLHDKYIPSGNAHYSFDFYIHKTMFDIYAAKGGRIFVFNDETQNNDHSNVNYLVIEDKTTDPTTYQLYLHLAQDSIPPSLKYVGAPVIQGQFIGVADNTGQSTGHHLHFQVETEPYGIYWGSSVDITFNDVDINGGRPRIEADIPYCTEEDICEQTQRDYISGNTPRGDLTAPTGGLYSPSHGITVFTNTVSIEGWAQDDDSGLYSVQLIANYDGGWNDIGNVYTSTQFTYDWSLCEYNVPDGPVSLALWIRDQDGNVTYNLPGLRHFSKKYSCPDTSSSCVPQDDQVALFSDIDYQEYCSIFDIGQFTTTELNAVGNNNIESIKVGSNVLSTLFSDPDYGGRGESFTHNDSNLADNSIGANQVSSLIVQTDQTSPSTPSPLWPTSPITYTTQDSFSLSWQNSGGTAFYKARLLSGQSEVTSTTWQPEPYWHLNSLDPDVYTWQVKSGNDSGESQWSNPYTITVQSSIGSITSTTYTAPYTDTMENGYNDWVYSNYWDQTASDNHTLGGSVSWMYDTNSLNGYDTGLPNSGYLTTPPIYIPDEGFYLHFWYTYQTENDGINWDQRWIQISVDGGPFTNLLQLSQDPPNFWLQSPMIDLSDYVNSTIQIRFYFNTIDENYNSYKGWYIDDFYITKVTPATCNDQNESNDTPVSASQITYSQAITAQICPGGDLDYYKFDGKAGERIGVVTKAKTDLASSDLDTYLYLLDSDGSSVLDLNDDQILYERTDSYLNYTINRNDVYYLKVRAWNHPSVGGGTYTYTINLTSDSDDPNAAFTFPSDYSVLPTQPISLTVSASDITSEISRVQFLWHSGDWLYSDWDILGEDWYGDDGWSFHFDPTDLPYQTGIAFYANVYDWAGNWAGTGVWYTSKPLGIVYLPHIRK